MQASPAAPHGIAETFEVSLTVLSLDPSFPSQVDSMFGRALVEPMGVFQIPSTTYSALEGTTVSYIIKTWLGRGGLSIVTDPKKLQTFIAPKLNIQECFTLLDSYFS